MAQEPAWLSQSSKVDSDSWLDQVSKPVDPSQAKKDLPLIDITDIASSLGETVTSLPTTVTSSLGQMYEGTMNPWEKGAASIERQKEMRDVQREAEKAQAEAEASGEASVFSRAIRSGIPSYGFTGAIVPPSLVAGGVASLATAAATRSPVAAQRAGMAAGTAASGYAAYRMAASQFLDDARERIDNFFLEKTGRLPNKQEQDEAYQELLPLAQEMGMAEALPEAFGNLALAGAGKYIYRILGGKTGVQQLASGALSKVKGMNALKAVGAGAAGAGTEVLTEAGTDVLQESPYKKLEEGIMRGQPVEAVEIPPFTLERFKQGVERVAEPTLATTALFGLAGAGIGMGVRRATREDFSQDEFRDKLNKDVETIQRSILDPNLTEGQKTNLTQRLDEAQAGIKALDEGRSQDVESYFNVRFVQPMVNPAIREAENLNQVPGTNPDAGKSAQAAQEEINKAKAEAARLAAEKAAEAARIAEEQRKAAEKAPTPTPISIADSPSPNLLPRATENVEPKPIRNAGESREDFITRRDAWDEQYGGMRKGGRTHNDDGTPYQPTVRDEVANKAFNALKEKSSNDRIDAIGSDIGAELSTSIEQLLNDGWIWDDATNRMVDPQNRGETPLQALMRIRGVSQPVAGSATITPAPAPRQSAAEKALGLPPGTLAPSATPPSPQTGQTAAPAVGKPTLTTPTQDATSKGNIPEIIREEPQDGAEGGATKKASLGDRILGSEKGKVEEEVAQPPAAVVSTEAPQPSPNLPALIAVRDNNATPEQVQSLVAQGLVEQVDGQNIITEAGVAAMPEDQRPKLTPTERTAEVKGTAAPGGSAEAIANQPKKGDLVTVALGGREYPKTKILNVINTPEGVRYQVDVFGPKFVAESSIIAVEKPIIKTAPKVAATPQLIRQLGDIAVKNKQPLDQGYIDSIGGNIPQGYVKQGDLYVFQPQTTQAATVKSTELRIGDEVSFKGNTYRVKKILSDGRVRAEFTNPEGIARIPKGSENITTLPRNVNFTRIEKQPSVTAPVAESTAVEKPSPAPLREGAGVTGVAQSEPVEGSIPTVREVSPETETLSTPQSLAQNKEDAKQQKKDSDENLKALNSLEAGTKTNPVFGTVTREDANEAMRLIEDGKELPNVFFTVVTTREEFLADPRNEQLYPQVWNALKTNKKIEGLFDDATNTPFVFTDGVVIYDLDRKAAQELGISPQVAAVRRVLRHENIHKGMLHLTPSEMVAMRRFLATIFSEEALDNLAKTYTKYANWRSDPRLYFQAIEEIVNQKLDQSTVLPKDGIWGQFFELLTAIWRRITGKRNQPTVKDMKDVMRLVRNGLIRSAKAQADQTKDGGNVMLSYVGEKAIENLPEERRQFMRDSLDAAKAMAATGKSNEEIRAATGWYQNPYDGKMRWEVPDEKAKLTSQWEALEQSSTFGPKKILLLSEVLDHPELFALYPELANVSVTKQNAFLDFFGSVQGWFNSDTNTINITPRASDQLSTMLHEVQHWIQEKEGFASGSNTESAMKKLSPKQKIATAEKMREKAPALIKKQEDKIREIDNLLASVSSVNEDMFDMVANRKAQAYKALSEAHKQYGIGSAEASAAYRDVEAAERDILMLAGINPDNQLAVWDLAYPIKSASSLAKLREDAVQKKKSAQETLLNYRDLLINMLNSDEQFEKAVKAFDLSYQLYQAVAGEIEARDVQARQKLTPEQRAATAPYSSENIAPEDAIVMFDDAGAQMSMAAPEMDAEYLAAVEAGDMEKAQRMVDEAAKAAMPKSVAIEPMLSSKEKASDKPLLKLFHGTDANFNVFERGRKGITDFGFLGIIDTERHGIFFAENKKFAETFAKSKGGRRVVQAFLNVTNPFSLQDAEDILYARDIGGEFTEDTQMARWFKSLPDQWEAFDGENGITFTNWLSSKGYDGAIIQETGVGLEGEPTQDVWVALSPNQIKSADPVTYDDQGNVIPLSQRFQPTSPDIRFSLPIVHSSESEASYANGQMAASMVTFTPRQMDVYSALEGAYNMSRKPGRHSVPLSELYQAALEALPDMTQQEFSEAVQTMYQNNSALLNAGESNFSVVNKDGDRVSSVVFLGKGPMASIGGFGGLLGKVLEKAKRIGEPKPFKSLRKDMEDFFEQTPKTKYTGWPFKDFESPDHVINQGKKVLEIARRFLKNMRDEGLSDMEIVALLTDPDSKFISEAINFNKNPNQMGSKVAVVEAISLMLANSMTSEQAVATDEKTKAQLKVAIDSIKNFVNGLSTASGQSLQFLQTLQGDPEISDLYNFEDLERKMRKNAQKVVDVNFGSENPAKLVGDSMNVAATQAGENVANDIEGQLEDAQDITDLELGEATLTEPMKPWYEEFKKNLETIGRITRLKASRNRASSAMESLAPEEISGLEKLSDAELDAMLEKLQSRNKELYQKMVGSESAADTNAKKDTRKKREKMINTAEKRSKQNKPIKPSKPTSPTVEQLVKMMGEARPSAKAPFKKRIQWRQLLSQPAANVAEYRERILDAIKKEIGFDGMTDEEKQNFADLFTEAWKKQYERIFSNELNRHVQALERTKKPRAAKALKESKNQLLEDIDLGVLNNDRLVEILAKRFGIKSSFTEEDKKRIYAIRDKMNKEGISSNVRNRLARELAIELARTSEMSILEVLGYIWVSSVLSGLKTMFAIGMSFLNGIYIIGVDMPIQVFSKLITGDFKGAVEQTIISLNNLARYFGKTPEALRRSWAYLVSGDTALLEAGAANPLRFMQSWSDLDRHQNVAEIISKDPNTLKRWIGLYARTVGRMLTALDGFNIIMTKGGALSMAMRQSGMDGETILKLHRQVDPKIIRQKIINEDPEFNGREPTTTQGKALLDAMVETEMYKQYNDFGANMENADFIASESAQTMNPTGVGGVFYSMVKGLDKKLKTASSSLNEKVKFAEATGQSTIEMLPIIAANYVLKFLAYNAINMIGLRFARFAGNKFNQGLSYLPLVGFMRALEAQMGNKELVGKEAAFYDMLKRNQIVGMFLGVLGIYALKAIADEPDDEERGWWINGGLENMSIDKKKQYLDQGKKPYSIGFRIGEKQYNLSYQNWPVSQIFSAIGAISDMIRFSPEKWAEKSSMDVVMAVAATGITTSLDLPALSGLRTLAGRSISSSDPSEQFWSNLGSTTANWVGGFVPKIFSDIDYLMEPNRRKYEGFWEKTAANIPVYRRYIGEDYYNIYSDKIERETMPWSRDFLMSPTEPAYRILGALNSRNIFLTPANAEYRMVGKGRNRRRLTQEEADAYSFETGKGYKAMILRYGPRALQMDPERAKAFLHDKADQIRDRALKKVYRGYRSRTATP